MSWVSEKDRLEKIAHEFDPAIRLVTKDSWFWKALAWLLFIVTFGATSRTRFLERFATTIGPVMGFPAVWTAAQVEALLPHEGRHVYHARVLGFYIHPWIGLPLYFILYILVPIPVGFSICRALFELDADRASWLYWYRKGVWDAHMVRARAQAFATTVAGSAYGWSLPGPLVRWLFGRAAEKVIA